MNTYKVYYKGFFKGTVEAESERDAFLQALDSGEWPDANHLHVVAVVDSIGNGDGDYQDGYSKDDQ